MTEDDEIEDLLQEVEALVVILYTTTNLEVALTALGQIIHGIICADDTIPEDNKAAYAIVAIGRFLTPSVIDHFNVENLPERIEAEIETVKPQRLH